MNDSVRKKNLILAGIDGKKWRTLGTAAVVAVLSFIMLISIIIISSIGNGINSLSERMGADLMVVPLGYESGASDILIKGEPSYFYIDRSVLGKLDGIEGIDIMSPQFYLTSSSQGCCDIPVQFIGIDEKTDFSVMPWVKEIYKKEGLISESHMVVGSDIDIPSDGKLRFFDEMFTVSAVLEETGTGLDQAVFTDMATIRKLFWAARKKGFNFTENVNPDTSISSIMVRVRDGYTPEEVKHNIRSEVDGLQIIETKNMINSIEGSLSGFKAVLYIMVVMLTIFTAIILSLIFSMKVKENIRIYAVMRSVGASSGQVIGLVLKEALILSFTGAATGICLASLVIYPFNNYISTEVHIPYLLPNIGECLIVSFLVFVIEAIVGAMSAMASAIRAGKADIYLLGRQV